MNYKVLTGREIGTIIENQKNVIGKLEQSRVEQKEGQYRLTFDNGFTLLVKCEAIMYHTLMHYENDCICFEFTTERVLSGMIAYSLYETYGLPLEFTVDVLSRHGIAVDEDGFHVMEMLHRELNRNTYKNKDAFLRQE